MVKKESLESKKQRLEILRKEMAELEPARARYYDLSFEASKLAEEVSKTEKQRKLNALEEATNFENCDFYNTNLYPRNGQATFENEDQAVDLCMALSEGSYYKAYHVEDWKGPGLYVLEPEWKYDHDRERVYSGVFKKATDPSS